MGEPSRDFPCRRCSLPCGDPNHQLDIYDNLKTQTAFYTFVEHQTDSTNATSFRMTAPFDLVFLILSSIADITCSRGRSVPVSLPDNCSQVDGPQESFALPRALHIIA